MRVKNTFVGTTHTHASIEGVGHIKNLECMFFFCVYTFCTFKYKREQKTHINLTNKIVCVCVSMSYVKSGIVKNRTNDVDF